MWLRWKPHNPLCIIRREKPWCWTGTATIRIIPLAEARMYRRIRKSREVTPTDSYVRGRTKDVSFESLMMTMKRMPRVMKFTDFLLTCYENSYPFNARIENLRLLVGLRKRYPLRAFIRAYPLYFRVFKHPLCDRKFVTLSDTALSFIREEENAIRKNLEGAVNRLRKVLMMSVLGYVPLYAIMKVYHELGLPDDFVESILKCYPQHFCLCRSHTPEKFTMVKLVTRDPTLAITAVEKWRFAEFGETNARRNNSFRYCFKIQYPPRLTITDKLKSYQEQWQRVPYISPYENRSRYKTPAKNYLKHSCKRAVAILHEFLSLTVEKMAQYEKFIPLRKYFGIHFNVRKLIVDHPGVFYMSTKGGVHTIFLRECYRSWNLVEPNRIYLIRRQMLYLLMVGRKMAFNNINELPRELANQCADQDVNVEEGSQEQLCTGLMKTCMSYDFNNKRSRFYLDYTDSDESDLE